MDDSKPTLEQVIQRKIEIADRALADARAERPEISKGELALLTMASYAAALVPTAYWPGPALREIVSCYRSFKEGKPGGAFRRDIEKTKPAPLTLGEAFGVPNLKGGHTTALKRRKRALATPDLVALFTGQGCESLPKSNKVPRTKGQCVGKSGYERAADKVKLLTPAEVKATVESWPKPRKLKKDSSP